MNTIDRIGVVGAGTMGHGIAQMAAQSGFRAMLFDVDQQALERALESVAANLDKGVEKGKVTPENRQRALANLSTSSRLEELADSDLVIEAVPEKVDLKRSIFARLDSAAPEGTIFASNTSSLSIAGLCEGLSRPDRFLGMHFFNPAHIMPLLEIVVHANTSDATLETARAVGTAMGKTSIVVRDSPGFATSRLGLVLGLEAIRMLEAGVATAEDIDTAMELGYRHPMGPLRLTDLVGLDVRLGIAEYLHGQLGSDAFEPPALLRAMVEDGKLGRKAGVGFYDWRGE